MKSILSSSRIFLLGMSGMMLLSCTSSRWQQGYEYRSAENAPDVSGAITPSAETVSATNELSDMHSVNPSPTLPAISLAPVSEVKEPDVLGRIIADEMQNKESHGETVNTREEMHRMALRMAESQHKTLTTKQLRKLDRYAEKMQKKQQQGKDIHWGPSNNLETFILVGAGIGLIVGILGIGFGWFVFLVLALVYLYFKLLKKN